MVEALRAHCEPVMSGLTRSAVPLLEHLGPEKTLQLWHLFFPPQEDYVKTRRKLFAGMDVAALAQEARKFNRE
jgi:hypothetical protein